MNIEIKQVTFDQLYNDISFPPLLEEYGIESKIDGLPPVKARVEWYQHYEKLGVIYIVAAYLDSKLIGLASVLSPIMPHYSAVVSVCESLFVMKEFRKTGAGLKIIKACEEHAKKSGSGGLMISSKLGSSLAELLSNSKGYKETNRVFFRKFENANE